MGVDPFLVAFVVTPLASNSSEVVSSLLFARKKRRTSISLCYSQIYGAITMNNTLCLGIFLAIVHLRGLTWDFSAEVTAMVGVILATGALGSSRQTFNIAWALPVVLLYPVSLAGGSSRIIPPPPPPPPCFPTCYGGTGCHPSCEGPRMSEWGCAGPLCLAGVEFLEGSLGWN